jgi:hypothetical protein
MVNERNEQSRLVRIASTAAVTVAAIALTFAAVGGVYAKSPSSAAVYYGGKVTICHKAGPHGKRVTITVSRNALPAHMRHGDTVGPCPTAAQKAAAAKKAKAAAAEKAKAAEAAQKAAKQQAVKKDKAAKQGKASPKKEGKPSAGGGQQPTQPAAPPAQPTPGKSDKGKGNEDKGDNGNGKGKGKGK